MSISRARVVFALLCTALIAAAFAFSAPAHAQETGYVDLSIEIVPSTNWKFIARNHGTADAYGVTVDIEIADQTIPDMGVDETFFTKNTGTACTGKIPGTTCTGGVRTVGKLEAGEEMAFTVVPRLVSGLPCCTDISMNWTVPARAVIKNTVPVEEERFKGDNTATGWISVSQQGTNTQRATVDYWLEASVNNHRPQAGGGATFSFVAKRGGGTNVDITMYGVKLRMELTEGLGTPTPTLSTGETFAAVTGLTRTWDWDIPVTTVGRGLDVTVTLASGADVSAQCLTAVLTVERPADGRPSENSAEICFRDDPVTLFQTGETDLFTLYPCVGVTTHPCSSSDSLELVVKGGTAAADAGISRMDPVMAPGNVVVHVQDPLARSEDSSSNLVWYTGSDVDDHDGGVGEVPGVIADLVLPSPDFNQYVLAISDVGAANANDDIEAKPGNLKILNRTDATFTILDIDNQSSIGPIPTTLTDISLVFEFRALGTYVTEITATATHVSTTTDYTDKGTYTFHVGPVAELEVRDNGSNPQVAADQRAFTIVAVNNGPDDAPAAQVTVTGLNASDYVSHTASHGTFNSTTGVWTIGELREDSGYYRTTGHSLGWPALTIITSAAGDTEITAAITNTQDYQVCIDSSGDDVDLSSPSQTACTTEDSTNSWHTAKYYDYISDNNSATIKAKDGAGADLPALQSAQEDTASIIVTWDPVGVLNQRLVTHYEVEWSADGATNWQQLSGNVSENRYVDTGVAPGDTRYYRVRAVNDRDQKGPWSQSIKGTVSVPETASAGRPEAPVLTASLPEGADGRTQIDLGWEKPVENGAPITSYTVEVADRSNGPWAAPDPAPQLGRSDTSWSHTGLTGGTRKYYRMKAANSQGDSEWSEVIDATTRAPGKAGPPLNVQAAPDGDAAIDVSWDPPADDGGSPIRYYEVQWSADGTGGWRGAGRTTDAETRTFKQTGLSFGTTRYYRVAARNGVTLGEWSDPPVSTKTLAGVPGIPGLTAKATASHTIELTWTEPADNGSPIIRYELEWSPDGSAGSWTTLTSPAAADKSYNDTPLEPGTERHYRIRAINGATPGEGSWSTVRKAVTPPAVPSAPQTLRAGANGQNAIDLTWDPPANDGGADISGYELQVSTDGTENSYRRLTSPSASARSYTHSNLQPGDQRYYQLRAQNRAGWSEFSLPASETTLTGVPNAPGLTVRAAAFDTVELTWTVPGDNGDPITGFQLEWSPDGSPGHWSPLTNPLATDTSYNDTPLEPGTERHYRIRAVNSTGNGTWSTVRRAVTPPAPPVTPTLRAEDNGQNAIDLIWEAPFDDGGADITGYELQWSADGAENSYRRVTSPSASARSYTHSGLQPGTTRHYQLRARNRAGWSEFSLPASATTLTDVPAAPALTVRANGASEIKLSWTKPDDRGSDIYGYHLQQSDDGNDWYSLGGHIPASDTEYVHTGLSGGTTKHYRVRALNGNGAGQWSQVRNARTDAGGPEAPVLTLTVMGDNQIDLGWTVPADNGSSIRGYWVERSVDGNEPWERLTGNNRTTTYSDTTLYRGVKRHYRVAATNGAGAGPYSEAKSATTTGDPATAPAAPTMFRLSEVGRNQVTIAWDPPTDDGGAPVSGYEYEAAVPCEDDPNTPENESEYNCGYGFDGGIAITGTSVTIRNLNTDGDYFFQVRAVNIIGKGEWSRDIQARLRPSTNGQVRITPTTINVNEGATVTYTIRLSTAPPHPVQVWIQPQGGGGYNDIEEAAFAYTQSLLVPNGWTHPDPDEAPYWTEFSYNWSQGVRVTFTAPEDADTEDDVAVMDHFVTPLPYHHYGPCRQEDQAERDQCRQAWDDAWANSVYQYLTGASVIVIVRDND